MNELQLSNDLTTIETEIKSYQNIGWSIYFRDWSKIKSMLKRMIWHLVSFLIGVKIRVRREYANKHIKVFEEFNGSTSTQTLGINALYEIATLPERERTKRTHNIKWRNKTPDEMTVRELRELKKQLKQRDEQNAQLQSQVEQAQRSEEIAKKQLEDTESREPEVIEKYMEPEDYQETKNALAQSRHQQNSLNNVTKN